MKALLIDIGSTFTKVAVADLNNEEVVSTAQSPTTVETDVTIGLKKAIGKLNEMGIDISDVDQKLACSSAAGGLRMIAAGLVPEYTVEAAKIAALGAGAKVIGTYSYGLNQADLKEIDKAAPDIILLSGGTDGGNCEVIIDNARRLSRSSLRSPIVVAGNKMAADQVASILRSVGKEVKVTGNVMPEINRLDVEPAKSAIRQTFLERIILAKGINKAKRFVDIIMPTPMAVLKAAELLAEGTEKEPGIGDHMIIEVGGSTTNIYSLCRWMALKPDVFLKGLPEPYAKRTIEGDLGIRYNAPSILEVVGKERLLENIGLKSIDIERKVEKLSENVDRLPRNQEETLIDIGLARIATEIAVERHVGKIETVFMATGKVYIQHGKDLTAIEKVIGTGGVIVHNKNPKRILEGTTYDKNQPTLLKPKKPHFLIDTRYILYAVGLLSFINPTKALRIAKRYIKEAS